MGDIILYRNRPAMSGNYGLAQSQAEAEAAAAVGNFGSCRIKHIKYMFLGLVGYPVTVVRYRYNSQISFSLFYATSMLDTTKLIGPVP